jgi:phosphoglucomutase
MKKNKKQNTMKKVINYLALRKAGISLQFDKLPADVDQYVAEIASELEEEFWQIEKAIEILKKQTP